MRLTEPKISPQADKLSTKLGIAALLRSGVDAAALQNAIGFSSQRFERAVAGKISLTDDQRENLAALGDETFEAYSLIEAIRRAKKPDTIRALKSLLRIIRGHNTHSPHGRKPKRVAELGRQRVA